MWLIVPFAPDSNPVCLALNRNGKRRPARMNHLVRRVFDRLKLDATRPVQDVRFVGWYTSLRREGGEDGQCGCILRELSIHPATFVAAPAEGDRPHLHPVHPAPHAVNPFLMAGPGGPGYSDMYWDSFEEPVDAALVE